MNIQTEIILDKLRPIREQGFLEIRQGDEYMELVQSLGVSEEEWGQLQEAFYDYLRHGKNYLQEHNLEDALKNLEKALLIRPDDIDTLSALSEVHLRFWQKKVDVASHQKADYFVKRCLAIWPEHEASQTRMAILHPKVTVNATARSAGVYIAIAAVIIALAMGILVFLTIREGAPMNEPHY